MITVAQARERTRAILSSKLSSWAVDQEAAASCSVGVALHPPTEREALADQAKAELWSREWSTVAMSAGTKIEWIERSWPSLGRQRIPSALRLVGADAVSTFAGGEPARRFRELARRAAVLGDRLGRSPAMVSALRKNADNLRALDFAEIDRLLQVVEWLAAHDVSGMRPRQLPIRGVDTKWIGAHRGLVTALHTATTGREALGLTLADHVIRLRMLDPALVQSGLTDFAAPPQQLSRLQIDPRLVLIVENLETVLSLPEVPGAVVVHGSGFAVDVVAGIEWVRRRPVLYWGDLDSHGFAILHRLRSRHVEVKSVLMDTPTLLDHRDLWVDEPKPAHGTYPNLRPAEDDALDRLREEGNVRLEQERIPLEYAMARILASGT